MEAVDTSQAQVTLLLDAAVRTLFDFLHHEDLSHGVTRLAEIATHAETLAANVSSSIL